LVGAQVLLLVSGTLQRHRDHQVDGGHLVMAIGASEYHRKRSVSLVYQEVYLCTPLAPISVGFLPVFWPPRGAGEFLESIACHFQEIPPRSLT
jgi:hypothetical protein